MGHPVEKRVVDGYGPGAGYPIDCPGIRQGDQDDGGQRPAQMVTALRPVKATVSKRAALRNRSGHVDAKAGQGPLPTCGQVI